MEDKARVVYYCESCEENGDLQSEIKHKDDCKNKLNVLKVCAKSGQGFHKDK